MKDAITLQQKVKVLSKLFEAKCRTEKDLQGLTIESILKIPNITILQKATKSGKLFSYLGGGADEQQAE